MATAPNPLSGFNPVNTAQSGQNPMLGWPGQTGVNQPSPVSTANPLAGAQPGAISSNPYGQGTRGGGDQTFNLAQTNLMTGLMRNQAIPSFMQNFLQTASPAAGYFQNLMNLGSPYYQQQQRASWEQGNQQNQNAAALARQQLGAQGFGYTPSGAGAAMLGGMAQGGAQSLSEQFLQNLFNNEQLQLAGAQGLSQMASLFNPSQLLSAQINPSIQQPTNTGAEWMGSLGQLFQGAGAMKPPGG